MQTTVASADSLALSSFVRQHLAREGWREWCSSSEYVIEDVVVVKKNCFAVVVVAVAGFVARVWR